MEKHSWDQVRSQAINESISRKMIWGENIMVTRWELAPGCTLPVHDHLSEQITMVERGSVTLVFPDSDEEVTVEAGQMLIIPPSVPHGVRIGPEGSTVVDLFSPIRRDFLEGTASYLGAATEGELRTDAEEAHLAERKEHYARLSGFLTAKGIKIPLEKLEEIPLEIVARYAYEKQALTMGELRNVLGLDKVQAKALLRKWKHGDDHSAASYQRMFQRLVIVPEGF